MRNNIKVGDIVFERIGVRYGNWGGTKAFTIPTKVVKVTSTQFIVADGSRYSKSTLKGIGRKGSVILKAKDQTKEMKAFKQKIALISEIKDLLFKLEIDCEEEYSLSDLESLVKALKKVKGIR